MKLFLAASVVSAPALAAPTGPSVTLNNGVQLPVLLWGSGGETQENSTSTEPAVRDALRAGFQGIGAFSLRLLAHSLSIKTPIGKNSH
jgi:hypothetical protein